MGVDADPTAGGQGVQRTQVLLDVNPDLDNSVSEGRGVTGGNLSVGDPTHETGAERANAG